MPVTVFEMQLLGVSANGFLALDTGVGTEFFKALHTAVASLLLHILLPVQRVAAVVAIKALRHGAHSVTAGPCLAAGGGARERRAAAAACRRAAAAAAD